MLPHQGGVDHLKTIMQQVKTNLEKDMLNNPRVYDAYYTKTKLYFDSIYNTILELEQLPLEYLPNTEAVGEISAPIQYIDQALGRLITKINGIPSDYNQATQQISSMGSDIELIIQEEPKLSKAAGLYIPYLAYKQGDYSEKIIMTLSNLEKTYNDKKIILERENESLKAIVEEFKKKLEKDSKEIEDIKKHSQESAAEIGIVPFAKDFETEYIERENSALFWIIITGFFVVLTFVITLSFYTIDFNAKPPLVYTQIALQISMIVLLFTITIWCSRMYRIAMHQVVVNKHRALSLRTFQTFISSTSDPHVKDAVLMEATRTIFNQGHTGYIDPKSDGSDSDTKIVEIIKNQNLIK